MLACYCICILLMGVYYYVVQWENKKRDQLYGMPQEVHEGTADGFVDITDKNQPDFRFTS